MLQINVKTAKENKDNPMVTLKLNSASVPRVGEKITIDGMQDVIRSIVYNTDVEQTSGDYFISDLMITASTEE